jgi:hypothetical protein
MKLFEGGCCLVFDRDGGNWRSVRGDGERAREREKETLGLCFLRRIYNAAVSVEYRLLAGTRRHSRFIHFGIRVILIAECHAASSSTGEAI